MHEPVVVKAIIINQSGQFLLQHRDNIAGIAEPNCWSFFGGLVEQGETLIAALERELQEELSCQVGQIEEELFRWHQKPTGTLHICFAVRFIAKNEDIFLREGQDFAWFFFDEFARLALGSLVSENLSLLGDFVHQSRRM